jgi:alpha-beta hydrolase superfamily lysophospholipase
MSATPAAHPPIVFVHGLWLHAESWQNWVNYFRAHGYAAGAASWPGDAPTTAATRANPPALAGYGVTEIAAHLAAAHRLPTKPILIGHCSAAAREPARPRPGCPPSPSTRPGRARPSPALKSAFRC